MSEELDVFAGAMKHAPAAPAAGAAPQQGAPKKKFYRKPFARNGAKQNNSPLRGANGEESVNPLLNAPLPPAEQKMHPPVPIVPSLFGQLNPPLIAIL